MDQVLSRATERILQLSCLPGIGAGALRKIIARERRLGPASLDDEKEILASFSRSNGPAKQCRDAWKLTVDRCQELDIHILSPFDSDYPKPLVHISDFPTIIYVRGSTSALNKIGCAVVGTRDASHLGCSWGRQIAETFAIQGFCVVSGLALGIDTAAHEGALRANGSTVSILAHGLDRITPASNKGLAEKILECGGALVSEHPPGTPPRKAEYVKRNRIQSGMSVCSVVVESGEEGGAIHQGNFTARQKRRLYCVIPDSSVSGFSQFRSAGGRRLMSEAGATPIHSREELVQIIKSGILQKDFANLTMGSSQAGEDLLLW